MGARAIRRFAVAVTVAAWLLAAAAMHSCAHRLWKSTTPITR